MQPNPAGLLRTMSPTTVQHPGQKSRRNNDAYVHAVVLNPSLQTGQSYDIWYGAQDPLRNATIVRQISGTDYATVTATLGYAAEFCHPRWSSRRKDKALFTLNDAQTQISLF